MKLSYQQATISFCMDLTSPDAPSLPVANLLVGEAEGQLVASVAVIVPDQLDAISRAVLGDTHQLIRTYVDEAFQKRDPQAPLGEVLTAVYDSLRHTMHVGMIAEPAQVEIPGAEQLGPMAIQLVQQGLVKSLGGAGFDMPSSLLWAPPARKAGLSAAR